MHFKVLISYFHDEMFALGRKSLGKAVNKLVPISVFGILDYSGAELIFWKKKLIYKSDLYLRYFYKNLKEYFKRLVELANQAKLAYQDIVEELEKEECEVLISQSKNTNKNSIFKNINFFNNMVITDQLQFFENLRNMKLFS